MKTGSGRLYTQSVGLVFLYSYPPVFPGLIYTFAANLHPSGLLFQSPLVVVSGLSFILGCTATHFPLMAEGHFLRL